MIAYRISAEGPSLVIQTSAGHSYRAGDLETALDILHAESRERCLRVFWDLDQSVALILKWLPRVTLKELFGYQRCRIGRYTIIYNYKKNFALFVGSQTNGVTFYHLAQYYDQAEPVELRDVVRLGEELLAELSSIGVKPSSLSSGIAIMDERYDPLPLPTWEDIPDDVGEFAWLTSHKQWTEAHQLGHWPVAYDYDISAAYPSAYADLMDTRYGKWVSGTERPKEAQYGFLYGRANITAHVSPVIFTDAAGHLYSPHGSWKTYITAGKLDCLTRWNIGTFETEEAWWWVPTKDVRPLRIITGWLYKQRGRSPLLNRVVKLGMNGLYGKMLQVFPDGEFGKRFNPVWGALTEDAIQCAVCDFIYQNNLQNDVICISTDGVLSAKQAQAGGQKRMGEWIEDSRGPALIVSSSTVFFGKKRPHMLTYHDALACIKSAPAASEWHRPVVRRMTLGDMLQGTGEIGQMREVETGFKLKTVRKEHDRLFGELPQTGRELLDCGPFTSTPLNARRLKNGIVVNREQESL